MSDNPGLTLAALQEMHTEIWRLEAERTRRNAENTARFIESVPAHLRSDPLISEMCYFVATGQPMHPKDKENYRRRYEALVARSTP